MRVQTCKVHTCTLVASVLTSPFHSRSPRSLHSWQEGFQVVIPTHSHTHPSLSPSSCTRGAPTKISKTHCFVLPVPLLTRDASRKHGQGLARMMLGHLVFMPLIVALCFPVHIHSAVCPLTRGVQTLGKGQRGKIAEKAD